jgi:hypothetical protein
VVTHKNSIGAGPDGVTEYICAARLVGSVDPGAVKRARQVYHCITRTHWDRDAVCQVRYRNCFQSVDSRIVVRASVRI